jgi:Flp pilus assembly protein TadD
MRRTDGMSGARIVELLFTDGAMDRTALSACAGMLLPLGALVVAGCGSSASEPSASTDRPAVLMELQAMAPGPWRRLEQPLHVANVAPADLPPVPEPSQTIGESAESAETSVPDVEETPVPEPASFPTTPEPVSSAPPEPESSVAPQPAISAAPEAPPAADLSIISPSRIERHVMTPEPVEAKTAILESGDEPQERRTQLPWAQTGPRSAAMDVVAQRAQRHVDHAFQMAERGATYTARSEFIKALQLIAAATDMSQNTRMYSKALAAGLAALKEAGDFTRPATAQSDNDLARIVSGHRTTILKDGPLDLVSTTLAAQRYYTFAREQLALAANQEPSGSMALFGMAKLALGSASDGAGRSFEAVGRGMALYQAALMADCKNYRAGNELGVLLAENGDLQQAREVLIHSVTVSSQLATWQNLSVVHARLGERQLADRAAQHARTLAQASPSTSGPNVQWLDSESFNRSAPLADGLPLVATPNAPAAAPAATAADSPKEPVNVATKKSVTDWLPWNIRR